jgi:YesN/AraC family two-component response regulator
MSEQAKKTRILFVDDEPQVLKLLQLMLRPISAEWEVVCADSGEAALKVMEASSFDIVVSDMRMPGMNGAQLLNEIMKRHPSTLRIILSGYADQEIVLKCVSAPRISI